jgi:hypothetical protein
VDLRRLRPFDALAGLFGAGLVGLLWAPWYHAPAGITGAYFTRSVGAPARAGVLTNVDLNAWQAMAVNDVIFFIAGALGIWVLVATAAYSTAAVPIAAAAFATFAAALASVLALVRLAWPPDLGPGPTHREVGAWLGAVAAIGLFASALASMRSERRAAAGSTDVPVTQLPAPRASGEGA